MRFLKRAGSDTELDVEGVKSAVRESPRGLHRPRAQSSIVRDSEPDLLIDDEFEEDAYPRRRRPHAPVMYEDEAPPVLPHPPRLDRAGATGSASTSAHRRAMSDGAVLAESQFERLEQLNRDSAEYNSDDSG